MDRSHYEDRRAAVRAEMGSGALLIFATPEFIRNGDVEHEYRQDSNFHYLTGLEEPQSALLLTAGETPEFILFVRPRDEAREIWDGPRIGVEGAKGLGADQTFPIDELDQRLPELLAPHDRLYYRLGIQEEYDMRVIRALRKTYRAAPRGNGPPMHVVNAGTVINPLRFRKTAPELEAMRRAITVTGEAHRAAMAITRDGSYEYELEAELRRVFRRSGSQRAAYAPIVGSGPNATILHHIRNDRRMTNGELVLIDAGCEYDYIASDITRTFPVSGKFSGAQRQVYDVVLRAQKAAFSATRAGVTLKDIHDASVAVIAEGLVELNLIDGPVEQAIEEGRYKKYFMHRTGHFLGMDVHDVGLPFVAGEPPALVPGAVITVEPGIYIAQKDDSVPEAFRGIGIRIEDDVLVTDDGYDNLSAAIPTDPEEVEALVGTAN